MAANIQTLKSKQGEVNYRSNLVSQYQDKNKEWKLKNHAIYDSQREANIVLSNLNRARVQYSLKEIYCLKATDVNGKISFYKLEKI